MALAFCATAAVLRLVAELAAGPALALEAASVATRPVTTAASTTAFAALGASVAALALAAFATTGVARVGLLRWEVSTLASSSASMPLIGRSVVVVGGECAHAGRLVLGRLEVHVPLLGNAILHDLFKRDARLPPHRKQRVPRVV